MYFFELTCIISRDENERKKANNIRWNQSHFITPLYFLLLLDIISIRVIAIFLHLVINIIYLNILIILLLLFHNLFIIILLVFPILGYYLQHSIPVELLPFPFGIAHTLLLRQLITMAKLLKLQNQLKPLPQLTHLNLLTNKSRLICIRISVSYQKEQIIIYSYQLLLTRPWAL